jgi:hypothetical protein
MGIPNYRGSTWSTLTFGEKILYTTFVSGHYFGMYTTIIMCCLFHAVSLDYMRETEETFDDIRNIRVIHSSLKDPEERNAKLLEAIRLHVNLQEEISIHGW